MALTPKQSAFVAEYLKDLNATQAAIRAGYSSAGATVTGSKLLAIPKVKLEVDAALRRRAERVEVKTDDVLRELLRLAMVDIGEAFTPEGNLKPIHEIPADVRRAIASVEVEALFEGRGEDREHIGNLRKVKFWDKKGALELLGKHLKLFTDKVEHDVSANTLEALVMAARAKGDKP